MSQPAQQQSPRRPVEDDPNAGLRGGELPGQRSHDGQVSRDHRRRQRIGRAVAIAFAREGADVLISYLSEDEDARDTAEYVEKAGQKAVLVRGDISDAQHCRDIIARAVEEFGKVDVLVSNAAYQMTYESLDEIPDDDWGYTFRTNVEAMFHLCKAAVPHMPEGSSIIGSSSVNSDMPSPTLAPYAATKAAIANFTASLAQLLGG